MEKENQTEPYRRTLVTDEDMENAERVSLYFLAAMFLYPVLVVVNALV